MVFRFLKYAHLHEVHWTQKYDQEVHEDDKRYKIIATPVNSNKF